MKQISIHKTNGRYHFFDDYEDFDEETNIMTCYRNDTVIKFDGFRMGNLPYDDGRSCFIAHYKKGIWFGQYKDRITVEQARKITGLKI